MMFVYGGCSKAIMLIEFAGNYRWRAILENPHEAHREYGAKTWNDIPEKRIPIDTDRIVKVGP
jgi:hypothetical protein